MAGQRQCYFVGLDLGQAADYTALAVLHRDATLEGAPAYTVGHLQRFALKTPYPAIVEGVARLLARPPLAGAWPLLVVDGTGVGRAVVDELRATIRAALVPVTITAGNGVSVDPDGYWRVAKLQLISTMHVLLGGRRLLVPEVLKAGRLLLDELTAYRVKVTAAGNETYESWRDRDHDDLVLAVALAAWAGELALREDRAAAAANTEVIQIDRIIT